MLDGEPIYEGHPVSFNADKQGHSNAADVRQLLYWDLFGGACGHTYGNHSIWQFWTPERTPVNRPLQIWTEAIDQPGVNQMRHGRKLIESRPYLTRIPDDSVILTDRIASSVPGGGAAIASPRRAMPRGVSQWFTSRWAGRLRSAWIRSPGPR